MSSRLLYCNAGFDLELAGAELERFTAQLAEMTLWFLPVGRDRDRIVLDTPAPADYTGYLRDLGLSPAVPVTRGEHCAGAEAFPWGWAAQAVTQFRAHGIEAAHPDLGAVRRVNSREFSFGLTQTLGAGLPGARLCRSAREVEGALSVDSAWPVVAKPDHGSTGIGFVLVCSADDLARARKRVADMFTRPDACVCVEPWLHRVMDLSVRYELAPDGTASAMRLSRARVTPAGSSYGVVHVPDDPLTAPHRTELERTAEAVAKALCAERYWGPVNIDAMVALQHNNREQLFPLVEINARQSVSFIAYEVQQRLAPGRPCLLRSLARARHRLPGSYPDLRTALGDTAFAPSTGTGVAILTPLRLGSDGRAQQPERSILFLAGRTAEDLVRLDRQVTAILAPAG